MATVGADSFTADFVALTHRRSRSVYEVKFEIDESQAQHALGVLGGLPREGESRPVMIIKLNERSPA